MSISTKAAIYVSRLAIAIAKYCRTSCLKKIEAHNREFVRTHEERRAALRRAEERRQAVIEAAARQAEADKQKASDIATARCHKIADRESKVQSELFEIESNCRLS